MPEPTTSIIRAAIPMRATVLAAEGARDGTFEALVSAYGVKYRIGWALWHTVEAGAFAASIAAQPAIPIYQMHSWAWSELPVIGHGEPREEERGLVVAGELYIADSEAARVVWRAMKAGALREWSIGYSVIAMRVDPDDDMHQFVTEAELFEASNVLRGANPATETLEVAGAGAGGGRTRITLAGGVVVDTDDPDLIARLTAAPTPPAPAPVPTDRTGLLARARVRELFGSTALAE
jgi:HK97 family phage prohead protease